MWLQLIAFAEGGELGNDLHKNNENLIFFARCISTVELDVKLEPENESRYELIFKVKFN